MSVSNRIMFYHSEKLQSTKTFVSFISFSYTFYHSEKLQSTKTRGMTENALKGVLS